MLLYRIIATGIQFRYFLKKFLFNNVKIQVEQLKFSRKTINIVDIYEAFTLKKKCKQNVVLYNIYISIKISKDTVNIYKIMLI